jgi:hypothetical protein
LIPFRPARCHAANPFKQNQDGNAFDYNYATPYVQNFTLSVTRDLSRTVNLDVRYIGNCAPS